MIQPVHYCCRKLHIVMWSLALAVLATYAYAQEETTELLVPVTVQETQGFAIQDVTLPKEGKWRLFLGTGGTHYIEDEHGKRIPVSFPASIANLEIVTVPGHTVVIEALLQDGEDETGIARLKGQ